MMSEPLGALDMSRPMARNDSGMGTLRWLSGAGVGQKRKFHRMKTPA